MMSIADSETVELGLYGSRYGEKEVSNTYSTCSTKLTHDLLRVQKFKRDVRNLLKCDNPIPGMILSIEGGVPQAYANSSASPICFPNNLISMELLDSIAEMADLRNRGSAEMPDICNLIQNAVSSRATIRKSIR